MKINSKYTIIAAIVSASIAAAACTSNMECMYHCLAYQVPASDLEEDPQVPGYHELECINHWGGTMKAPLPDEIVPGGSSYASRICLVPQSYFNSVWAAVSAKHDGDITGLSQGQIDDYTMYVESLQEELVNECIKHLTCDETFCDVDVDTAGSQACDHASATALCEATVGAVAEAALDLETGPDTPEYAGTGVFDYDASTDLCNFVPFGTDGGPATGGGSATGDGGGDAGADDTSDGGLDTTMGAAPEPFGDVSQLISCRDGECTVERELFTNILDNFDVFYSEGVQLQMVSTCGGGVGLSGLHNGDAAEELASAFGLADGDVITVVNGIPLDTQENALLAVDSIQQDPFAIGLTIRRPNACDEFSVRVDAP